MYPTIDILKNTYFELVKKVLGSTKNIKSQAELLKNKETLFSDLDDLVEKYNNLINDIKNDIKRK